MKTPEEMAARRQYFTTFCAQYVKRMIDAGEYYPGCNLPLISLWIFDFAIDAQNDAVMPKYPKKWTDIKRHLQDVGACKEAIVASWAAYWAWKNGNVNLDSFNRRKDSL